MTNIFKDSRGAAAVEFAIAAPVMALLIFGVLQLGLYGVANAGVKQAVDEAARMSIIYPRPTDASIKAALLQGTFGVKNSDLTVSLTHGSLNGGAYVDINARYVVPSIGLGLPTLAVSETRRAFQN